MTTRSGSTVYLYRDTYQPIYLHLHTLENTGRICNGALKSDGLDNWITVGADVCHYSR